VLKSIRLDSSIALDSGIGQGSEGPRGSSRVVRERRSFVLFWSCAYRIYGWLRQNPNILSWLLQYHNLGFSTRFD
jgi:hypothetical protein